MTKKNNTLKRLGLEEEFTAWKKAVKREKTLSVGTRVRIKKGTKADSCYVYTTGGSEGVIKSLYGEEASIQWSRLTGRGRGGRSNTDGTPIFTVRKEFLEVL